MEYFNSLLTEKSWEILKGLLRKPIEFTVIGGWAAYLWTRQQKSKDVDIVLDTVAEIEYLKKNEPLRKNDSLRKYEIRHGDVDVDVYVPYYSRLTIPPEKLPRLSTLREGFRVPTPEALCILKQGAEQERADTVKGLKDRIDVVSLLINTDFDYDRYVHLAGEFGVGDYPRRLAGIVSGFREGGYIGLNPRQLKLKRMAVTEKIRKARAGH